MANRIDSPPTTELITPSDVTTYDPPIVAYRVGTAGDLAIVPWANRNDADPTAAAVTIPANAIAVGVQISEAIYMVMSTNTTASEIVANRYVGG